MWVSGLPPSSSGACQDTTQLSAKTSSILSGPLGLLGATWTTSSRLDSALPCSFSALNEKVPVSALSRAKMVILLMYSVFSMLTEPDGLISRRPQYQLLSGVGSLKGKDGNPAHVVGVLNVDGAGGLDLPATPVPALVCNWFSLNLHLHREVVPLHHDSRLWHVYPLNLRLLFSHLGDNLFSGLRWIADSSFVLSFHTELVLVALRERVNLDLRGVVLSDTGNHPSGAVLNVLLLLCLLWRRNLRRLLGSLLAFLLSFVLAFLLLLVLRNKEGLAFFNDKICRTRSGCHRPVQLCPLFVKVNNVDVVRLLRRVKGVLSNGWHHAHQWSTISDCVLGVHSEDVDKVLHEVGNLALELLHHIGHLAGDLAAGGPVVLLHVLLLHNVAGDGAAAVILGLLPHHSGTSGSDLADFDGSRWSGRRRNNLHADLVLVFTLAVLGDNFPAAREFPLHVAVGEHRLVLFIINENPIIVVKHRFSVWSEPLELCRRLGFHNRLKPHHLAGSEVALLSKKLLVQSRLHKPIHRLNGR